MPDLTFNRNFPTLMRSKFLHHHAICYCFWSGNALRRVSFASCVLLRLNWNWSSKSIETHRNSSQLYLLFNGQTIIVVFIVWNVILGLRQNCFSAGGNLQKNRNIFRKGRKWFSFTLGPTLSSGLWSSFWCKKPVWTMAAGNFSVIIVTLLLRPF